MHDPDSYALFCSYVVQEAESGEAMVDPQMVKECRRYLRNHPKTLTHNQENPAYA